MRWRKLASKLQIIGNTPEKTKDVKDTIKYLEDIVINKDTLKNINTTKLVQQINRLLQYVEVLSLYKKPSIRLIKAYKETLKELNDPYLKPHRRKEINARKEILEELLSKSQFNDFKIERKDYWENYE